MSTIRQIGTVGLLIAGAVASHGEDNHAADSAGKPLAKWIEALKDPNDPDLRAEARAALGPDGPFAKVAVSALIEALGRKDPPVPSDVAPILADHGPARVPVLLRALKRPEVPVRVAIAEALGRVRPTLPEVVPALVEALKDPSPDVRASAASSLGHIKRSPETIIPALASALRDDHERVREVAAFALSEIGRASKPALPALITALTDKNEWVRKAAAEALGRIGPDARSAVPTLIAALRNKKYGLSRSSTVAALGEIGAEEGVPALIAVLQEENGFLRWSAISALGEIGPGAKAAVPTLIAIAKEKRDSERDSAIRALGKIGPDAKAAVPMLMEALSAGGRYPHFRYTVAEALGGIGPAAKPAVPALAALARSQLDGDSTADGPARKAAAAAVMKIDPEYGAANKIELSYLDVRLGKVPSIKLPRRPALARDKKDRIKKLIADLSGLSSPDFGLSPTLTGRAFAPLPDHKQFDMGLLTNHRLKSTDALRSLVEIGPDALPFLLEALDDKTPTKLKVGSGNFITVFGAELESNPLNSLERRVLSENSADRDTEDGEGDDDAAGYTLKVGDVCFVAIGQIVGRRYSAVRYQPTAMIIINSPVHSAELRRRVRAIWSSDDPAQHLLDSLLIDYATEGIFNGRSLDGWSEGSDRQIEAAVRLLYYFPAESVPLIAERLKQMEVARPKDDDGWMLREVANGVRTTDFLKAVSWCKEPAIRKALLDIFHRTDDVYITLAVLPSVQESRADLIIPRLRAMLRKLPESEDSARGDGYELLIALGRYAGKAAKPDFERYLRDGSLQRRWTMCWVLGKVHREWALEFLTPFLTDKRTGYASETLRLCDMAAMVLSEIHPDLRFDFDGTPEGLDRRIEALRKQIEQKRKN